MYERFTDDARRAMAIASRESSQLGHDYLGTEHILFGLMRIEGTIAARVLADVCLSTDALHAILKRRDADGPRGTVIRPVPTTPRAKRIIENAVEEANGAGATYVGTAHMLLAILKEPACSACQYMASLKVDTDRMCDVIRAYHPDPEARAAEARPPSDAALTDEPPPAPCEDAVLAWLFDEVMTQVGRRKDYWVWKADYERAAQLRELMYQLRDISGEVRRLHEGGKS